MTKEELFEAHKNMVYYCYNHLLKDDFITKSQEDLIQEGFLALWKACMSYDETLEIKLSSYAFPAIQNAMLTWIRNNKSYYYNHIGFDDPVSDQEDENLTIGNTIPDKELLDQHVIDVKEILLTYKKWLIKTRVNSNQTYINVRVYRAYQILNELVTKEKVSVRHIEEEYNISRTIVTKIFKELREALKDEYPTRFKNRRIQNEHKRKQS